MQKGVKSLETSLNTPITVNTMRRKANYIILELPKRKKRNSSSQTLNRTAGDIFPPTLRHKQSQQKGVVDTMYNLFSTKMGV